MSDRTIWRIEGYIASEGDDGVREDALQRATRAEAPLSAAR
jgi:hypothetical protein